MDKEEHYCHIFDIEQMGFRYKLTCCVCDKTIFWNPETNKFEDKIYPKGYEAQYNPVTLVEDR